MSLPSLCSAVSALFECKFGQLSPRSHADFFSNAFLSTGVCPCGITKALHTAATTRKED
jgi:hypothetical protein